MLNTRTPVEQMTIDENIIFKLDNKKILAGIICLAAILRVPNLTDDFWLDEIWSLNLATRAHSLLDIFTTRFDANHILNTVQMYLIGKTDSWLTYRVASLVSGLLSIFLVFKFAEKFGRQQAITAAILMAVCFPLVLYSSEARGYAMSIAFSLSALLSLQNYLEKPSLASVIAFWLLSVLAMLSHFTFIYIYAGFFQWSFLVLYKHRNERTSLVSQFLLLHTLPLAVFSWLYIDFIRLMAVAGANESNWWGEISRFVGLVYGLEANPQIATVLLVLTLLSVGWVTYKLWRANSEYWPLFILVVIINPVLVMLIANYGFPQMRYFLLLLPFLIVCLSMFISLISDQLKHGKYYYGLFILFFVISNLLMNNSFSRSGRGDYLSAMQFIVNNTRQNTITISSDHDIRNFALLEFYARYLPKDKTFNYSTQDLLEQASPEWYLVHDLSHPAHSVESLVVAHHTYKLKKSFYAYNPEIIGWHWHIYRKLD